MRDLPISLLRTFLRVADTANLTEAARQLHKAPSTVSMQLTRLEDLVGHPVLERGQYGVRLTSSGQHLLNHAQQLLNLHDQIVGALKSPHPIGKVRLGTHDQYASRTLAPILKAFVQRYPDAELEVFCDHRPDRLVDMLEGGKLDLALVEMLAGTEGGVRLKKDDLVWVSAHEYEYPTESPLPLAVFDEGCYHRRYACRALDRADIPWRIAFTSQSRAGVLAAVRAGIAVGIIPRHTVEQDLQIISTALPLLPDTEIALFSAARLNEVSARLQQTILDSQQFGENRER
ncbi:LysR family transcriptional regulator [Parathalassolituus penaei]|uniref:LysR family transcriptional regulator n=1 Tax=Parathalassolituus penaei TaxID=2997323 RepID=A0A9X3EGT6_9GAMM|nr:LysR family transcriptional regulator [Parathalassolituus penaei]MCY0964051.1 LysR family transcriptional regulator [Parathalassolituus penaei]